MLASVLKNASGRRMKIARYLNLYFLFLCLKFTADLVTFTEEIRNGKLHFLCSLACTLSIAQIKNTCTDLKFCLNIVQFDGFSFIIMSKMTKWFDIHFAIKSDAFNICTWQMIDVASKACTFIELLLYLGLPVLQTDVSYHRCNFFSIFSNVRQIDKLKLANWNCL